MSKDSTCYRFVDLTSAYVQILSSPAADTSEISKVRKLESGKSSLSDYMKWGDYALDIQRQNSSSSIHTQSQLHFSFDNPQAETMVHIFTKNLTFQSSNLGKETTPVLAFNGHMEGLYEDFFPVVWKTTKFGKSGPYRAQATYTSQ
ncbi:hypothetical protein EDD22DRAFT_953995 [Suillus occidentalis]|nr:hypothetical protein EDD22DRAFT_953995 [Suillus occidentalis]